MGERARYEHMLATGEELLESTHEQNKQFLLEMIRIRTPELLDKKIIEYLDVEGLPSPEVNTAYKEQKKQLEKLFGTPEEGLKKDLLYHGTGFYKYDRDKYSTDQQDTPNTVQLFEKILDEGLKIHEDPWMPDGDMESVSLAGSYFYAKWFAAKYMTKDNKPEWQLGDPNDFFRFFMADSVRAEKISKAGLEYIKKHKQRVGIKKERATKYENKLRNWTRSYRNDTTFQTTANNLLNGESDIPNNIGIILCLDKNKIPFQKPPLGSAHEVRTMRSILPEIIKAIGVPLKEINNIRDLLDEHGRDDIEVFAIECADLYFTTFKIQDLVARIE
ncbi:MAG: hypothetical protein WC070_01190 [Candidatus Magasanikbacteria bacterium]